LIKVLSVSALPTSFIVHSLRIEQMSPFVASRLACHGQRKLCDILVRLIFNIGLNHLQCHVINDNRYLKCSKLIEHPKEQYRHCSQYLSFVHEHKAIAATHAFTDGRPHLGVSEPSTLTALYHHHQN
jgi:hypothetical protein